MKSARSDGGEDQVGAERCFLAGDGDGQARSCQPRARTSASRNIRDNWADRILGTTPQDPAARDRPPRSCRAAPCAAGARRRSSTGCSSRLASISRSNARFHGLEHRVLQMQIVDRIGREQSSGKTTRSTPSACACRARSRIAATLAWTLPDRARRRRGGHAQHALIVERVEVHVIQHFAGLRPVQ